MRSSVGIGEKPKRCVGAREGEGGITGRPSARHMAARGPREGRCRDRLIGRRPRTVVRVRPSAPPALWFLNSPQILLCKKKILCHIKMSANAWSTKC
jgi:hypothetical protein